MSKSYDVVIVGAGAAGIGMALALQKIPDLKFMIMEAGEIGESFSRWPVQTRFITPSFHSTPFGLADLNAVNEPSSPAIHSGSEHLSGEQYAAYLKFLVDFHQPPIQQNCKVQSVYKNTPDGFTLVTDSGEVQTRFLIWATGEYQFPDLNPFSGATLCKHYAEVTDWQVFNQKEYLVIGGYESGIDATVNLVKQGAHVTLLIRKDSWDPEPPYDPSLSLSPYSRDRIADALETKRLTLVFSTDVKSVHKTDSGLFEVVATDGRSWQTAQTPILGTGFLKGGGASQIAALWEWDENGNIILTEADESTCTPGLFLVGPQVRQEGRIYCFIYKFRQRFGLVSSLIAQCLNLDDSQVLPESAPWGFFGNTECCEGCEC